MHMILELLDLRVNVQVRSISMHKKFRNFLKSRRLDCDSDVNIKLFVHFKLV